MSPAASATGITLADMLVPTYRQMLRALSSWMAKAEAQIGAGTADRLLSARLADDMFPLATQIRFACVQAYEGVLRLQRADFPSALTTLLDEGRDAGERPGTIADACARIDEALAFLHGQDGGALHVDPATPIAHGLPQGMIFDLTAEGYARDWTLPQFYFHVMIAYAILRREGVELGKADYIAHMLGFLRPGTMPAG